MLELTEKEWICINEYLKDLIKLLGEDDKNSYTEEEILILQNKVSNILRNYI